ncbi:hypothetical protein [Alicyclobacillus acidiphilus]|uniref:hypothetical protein n=1 Tax=Alicyclobacillus acidiphilus TaxID=182455 RepID=UPI000833FC13|nr:hypothetical protein [Alicyclobacillus acidiphilus]
MNRRQTRWTAVAAVLVGVGLLAGCSSKSTSPPATNQTNQANLTNTTNTANTSNGGSSGNTAQNAVGNSSGANSTGSNPTTNGSNATNSSKTTNNTSVSNTTGTKSASAFPAVVQQAMNSLGTNGFNGADAPEDLPQPATAGASLVYSANETTPSSSGPQFLAGYHVDIEAGSKTMAAWEVDHFVSSQTASASVASFASSAKGYEPQTSGNPTPILLPGNISANGSMNKDGSASVTWTSGAWNCEVTNEGTEVAPTPVADQLVSALSQSKLPTPDGTGRIIVDSATTSGSTETITVVWSQDGNVYQVETTDAANQPIAGALAMAGSMQPYSN